MGRGIRSRRRPADHEHLPGGDRALPPGHARPNFLILVGDHYGWRPLPPQIPAKEFDTLARYLSNKDQALADKWYELDDNARPALRRLRPRRDEFKQDDVWATVENQLHPALQKAAEEAGLQEDRSRVYRTSATE
ncbi:MAG TPA: hypothetical protein VIK32_13765, partial [Candidatus Limnocylindrales bacterium]